MVRTYGMRRGPLSLELVEGAEEVTGIVVGSVDTSVDDEGEKSGELSAVMRFFCSRRVVGGGKERVNQGEIWGGAGENPNPGGGLKLVEAVWSILLKVVFWSMI